MYIYLFIYIHVRTHRYTCSYTLHCAYINVLARKRISILCLAVWTDAYFNVDVFGDVCGVKLIAVSGLGLV